VVRTALWTNHCDGLRSTLNVVGHSDRGALGSARPEHPRDSKALVLIGVGSLVLLQIADFTIGFWLRGFTPKEQFVQLLTGQGSIYASLLVLFSIMPWAANCWLGRLKLRGHDR
jgi:hypothetical protein